MRIKVQHTDYLKRNGGRLAPRSPLVQCFWGSFLAATMEGKKCQIFADKSNFQNFFRNVVPFQASNWGANISSFVTTLGLEGFYLIHNSSPQEKQHLSHCPIVCFFFLFFFSAKDPSECHSLFLPPPPPLFFMWELSHSRQTSKKIPIALHLSQVPLLFKGLGNSDPLFQQLSLCNILLELHASYFSLVIQPNFH